MIFNVSIINYTKLAQVFYHGSKVPGLTQLHPRLDQRTGVTGVFLTSKPELATLHSVLTNAHKTSINYNTVGGKFTGVRCTTTHLRLMTRVICTKRTSILLS